MKIMTTARARLGLAAVCTWLVFGLGGCGGEGGGPSAPPPPPTTGSLEVSVSTTGVDLDVDAFDVTVGNLHRSPSEINGTVRFNDIRTGARAVALDDLAANCSVVGEHPRQVNVTGGTTRVDLAVQCLAIPPLLDRIVYRDCGDGISIWAIDPDGGNRVTLNESLRPAGAHESFPAVSPDGKRVAFARELAGDENIMDMLVVANVDGGDEWVLAEALVIAGIAWSPDGTRIAYHTLPGPSDIWVVDWDGSGGPTALVDHPASDLNAQWSPDGTKIAFVSTRNGGDWGDLYTTNADGSGTPTRLTFTGREIYQPFWSPDGRRIAWSSLRHATGNALAFGNDEGELYAIDADGSNATRLTTGPSHETGGGWSPDGTRLVFSSNRDALASNPQGFDLYAVDPDGTNVARLTTTHCNAANPVWSPASP